MADLKNGKLDCCKDSNPIIGADLMKASNVTERLVHLHELLRVQHRQPIPLDSQACFNEKLMDQVTDHFTEKLDGYLKYAGMMTCHRYLEGIKRKDAECQVFM